MLNNLKGLNDYYVYFIKDIYWLGISQNKKMFGKTLKQILFTFAQVVFLFHVVQKYF